MARILYSKSFQLLHIRLHFETCVDYTYKWNNIVKLLIFADEVVLCFEKMGKRKIMQQVDNNRWDLIYLFVVAQIYQLYTTGQLEYCQQLDNQIQSISVHNWTSKYSSQMYTTGQPNTGNIHTQLDNWIQSTTGQLNTVNNCTQLDYCILSTTVHNWTTECCQLLYTTGLLNTVNNCTQLDNWMLSTTVHNWTTECCQQLCTTGQVNAVNNCTQLDNWMLSTTVHNWTTECCQQLYTTGQLNAVNYWTTEYCQQLYTTGLLNTVNNCTQLDNWTTTTTTTTLYFTP